MRSVLLLALLAVATTVVVAQNSGSWGIYADNACSISLFNANFVSGQCGSQTSGSKTIYYITTCFNNNTQWKEVEYADSNCQTPIANTTNTNDSGACFVSGQYWGQVVCPTSDDASVIVEDSPLGDYGASILMDPTPVPVSAASVAAPSLIFAAVAAIVALLA